MRGAFSRIDHGLQDSYAWLDEVAAHIEGERRDAYHALHAVLTALRDRLPMDVALDLSHGMPLLVRGIFFDDFDPARCARTSPLKGFVAMVEERLAVASHIEPRAAIEAVMSALVRHVDARVLEAIEDVLPNEVRAHLVAPDAADAAGPGLAPGRAVAGA